MRILFSLILIFFSFIYHAQTRYWVAGSAANWSGDNWAASSGGVADGAGPPTAGQSAQFDANGLGNCTIDALDPSILNLVVNGYTGTIDLNGNTLTSTGTATLSSGTINDTPGTDSLVVNSTGNTTLNGTTFGAIVNITSRLVTLSGSTFNAASTFHKNGTGNVTGAGGNVFNAAVVLTHSGTNNWVLAGTNPDDFNDNLTINNTGSGTIFLSHTATGNTYDGNINVSSSGSNIYFGNNGGSSTLASGFTISVGTSGFTTGTLRLRNFTQSGATAQTLILTGAAILDIYDASWGGDVTFSAPRLTTRGTNYSGTVSLTKTGASNDQSVGGNRFNGNTTFTHSGSNQFLFGNGSPDTVDMDLTLVNSGTGDLYFAHNSADNVVSGNLIVTNSATNARDEIYVSNNAASTLTIGGDVTLTSNATASDARIYLGNTGDVTIGGNFSSTNSGAGTASYIYVANNDGSVVSIAGNSSVTNTAANTTCRTFLGNSGDVTFDGVLNITNSSTATNSEVYLHHNATSNNTYNQNITIEATNASTDGCYFGNNGGSGVLAASRTLAIGGGGYVGTALTLRNFTQTGATAQALTMSGATTNLTIYDCNWGGDVSFSSPRISTRGTTYSGTALLTKTGATDDQSVGGNNFTGNATLANSGSGYLLMGNGSPDTFGGDLAINNSGTRHIYLAYNSIGNSIAGDLTVTNSGTGTSNIFISSISGSTMIVNGTATVTNSASGTTSTIYLGDAGDMTFSNGLTMVNSSTAATGQIILADETTSTVSITGNTIATNNGAGTANRIYLGNGGSATFGGDLTLDNTNSATTGDVYLGNGSVSTVGITGNTTLTNDGSGSNRRAWLGNSGDVTFGGNLSITNNSDATDSRVYLQNAASSSNTYNGNISIESTETNCDGVFFGNSSGSGTLAATRTITIGGTGYVAAQLYLRNFTQTGATAQTLAPTGTTLLTLYDCNWGGDVSFSSPQLITRGTAYSGTATLEKTGVTDNTSVGGNTFTGNAILNNSGSGYIRMGAGSADTFAGDLSITNSGTRHVYLAHNSAGNTIAGNLTIVNSGSGTSDIYLSNESASTLSVNGTVAITNSGSGTRNNIYIGNAGDVTFGSSLSMTNSSSAITGQIFLADDATSTVSVTGNAIATNSGAGGTKRIYLGNAGPVTFGGDVTLSNSNTATTGEVYIGSGSASIVSISGNTILTNDGSGTNRRAWLGNSGDITFGGSLSITNNSDATNSQVYLNNTSTSVNTYNGNIVIESTEANCDGVFFGNSTGSGTLAATRTITIGGTGFIAAQLYLRNFTQTGATAQALAPTGTTLLTLYDNSWGGDVTFSSPQIITRGTTYSGTASLEKTGATDNTSSGGNNFTGNAIINNSGSGFFRMGDGSADSFGGDLSITNSGTRHVYIANNSAGNTVAGDLTIVNSGSGESDVYLSNQSASTLNVAGAATITNSASGTTSNIYLGNAGDLSFGSSLTITNSSTATTAQIFLSDDATSTVSVTGNTMATNSGAGGTKRIYLGNAGPATFGGDVTLNNTNTATTGEVYIGNGSASAISITGNTTITNDGSGTTRRAYLGNSGDVTFGGDLSMTNNSDATNSQIFLQHASSSTNAYNGNITVESAEANCDGIFFGNSTGSGTLAATRTISIGGSGFVATQLYLRNFTQIGATAQALAPTGTTLLTLYDSNWGGDVTFSSPQIITRGTTYSGTASLEKTGATDNSSAGGNTFTGNVTLSNSGSGYFLMGNNGNPDTFGADLDLLCSGSDHLYLGYNSAGNTVAGNLIATNSGTGTSHIFLSDQSASTLAVTGTATFINSSSGTTNHIYIGNAGDISFSSSLSMTNSSTATTGDIYLADNSTSSITIAGNTTATNSPTGGTNRLYLGNEGPVSFNGDLNITNAGSATTNEIYLGDNSTSLISISGNTTLLNSGSGTTCRSYLGNSGDVTFSGSLSIINSSTATNSQVYCNHASASSNTYSGNIIIECTSASSDGILFGNSSGIGTLAASRTISIGGGGFIAGNLTLRNFTQVGATAQTLNPTGTTTMLVDDSNWGGDVDFSSPRLDAEGSTFSGTALLEKTGSGDDRSSGGNTFNGNTTITNSGSGYWRFGEGTMDTFSANLDLVNSGSDVLHFAYSGAGHLVSGDLTATNSGTGTSYLYLGNNSSSTLTVSGTATFVNSGSGSDVRTYVGNSGDITFNGDVSVTNSASGNQGLFYVATQTNSAVSIAGNTTVSNSGAGTTKRTFLGNQGDITFTGNLDITNSSTATNSQVYCNYEDNSDNVYNGNIILESTSASNDGILFGNSGGEGILADGRTITLGAGGFIGSDLNFRNFTQAGSTAQSLAPTGTTTFTIRDCNWGGDVTFSSARITSRSSTYASDASIEKNGASNDNSYGDNTFNGEATFTQSGTGRWRLSSSVGNDFNGNVNYIKSNSGTFEPARQGTSTYAANINVDFNATVTIAVGNGTVEMDGTTAQSINDLASTVEPRFRRLILNNAIDEITLNTPISISTSMTFTQGNIITTDANLLTVRDEATVAGASDNSYVRGPIEKIGEDDFIFPVGDSGLYRPITISGGSGKNNSTAFRATYFEVNPDSAGWTRSSRDGTFDHVSANEYWILDRTNGSATSEVTLSWDSNSGTVDNLGELIVAKWNTSISQWENQGNGGTSGNTSEGTIVNLGLITSFSPFTLASTTSNNPLPIELVSFEAEVINSRVKLNWETAIELNNDYFTIERSKDGKNFEYVATIDGSGNTYENRSYVIYDNSPLNGTSYYRLSQTDYDGSTKVEGLISISLNQQIESKLQVFPNPANDGYVNINLNDSNNQANMLVLFSMDGTRLLEVELTSYTKTNQFRLDLSDISNGYYFIGIYNSQTLLDKQILIVN